MAHWGQLSSLAFADKAQPGDYCNVWGPVMALYSKSAGYSKETAEFFSEPRWFEVRCASIRIMLDDRMRNNPELSDRYLRRSDGSAM